MAAIVQRSSMAYQVCRCPLRAPKRAKASKENALTSLSSEDLDVELWNTDGVGSIGAIVFVVILSYLSADHVEFVARIWGHHCGKRVGGLASRAAPYTSK